MSKDRVDVIATTVSGSIQDWKKVERIVPLFAEHGLTDVRLHVVTGHRDARLKAKEAIESGGRIPISAGGSGTFRNVLEGCIESGVALGELRLGFLRKGSADLIGKVIDMPDRIEEAIAVFAESIRSGATLPCDVLLAQSTGGDAAPMHFVGYGGAEIFGRIPHFTENRFMKWYKGVLGQIFGDLGPFTTGMVLALGERLATTPFSTRRSWTIRVDGNDVAEGCYQALVIVNGYLGPDLPFASDPLGSGHFHLFALKDLGLLKLPRQAVRARDGSIMEEPGRWGMEPYVASRSLELIPSKNGPFEVNVDGATMTCADSFRVQIADRIPLIARSGRSFELRQRR
jgi:diacylglycerol kinase family enzyme